MIRYFFTGKGGEYVYNVNLEHEREIINSNDENVSIKLTFNGIQIKYKSKDVNRNDIYFHIYGLLYKIKENSDEQLNTTCKLIEQNPSFEAKTRHNYNVNHTEKWSLIFENIPRQNNFIYGLQLQANVILEDNIFNEEFLIFTTKVDLTDIKKENKDNSYIWISIVSSIVFILLLFIVFLVAKNYRVHKANLNLQTKIKSMAFSHDIQKNVLIKEKIIAKKDEDYETTFI